MGRKHGDIVRDNPTTGRADNHGVIRYLAADASARVAGIFTPPYQNEAADIDSLVRQIDTGVKYEITAIGTPPTTVEFIPIPSLIDAPSVFVNCIKSTAGTIASGELVYIAAAFDGANSAHSVELARADSASTMDVIGVTLEPITDSVVGKVLRVGVLGGFDTSSASVNDTVYASTTVAGGITFVKPTGSAIIQIVGIVSSVDVSNGRLEFFVRASTANNGGGRLFAVQGALATIGANVTKIAVYGQNVANEPPVMPVDGEVIAFSTSLNQALTSGTLTISILLNNVSQAETLVMTSPDQNEFLTLATPIAFNAGDTIGFQTVTVSAAPTGADPSFYALCEET